MEQSCELIEVESPDVAAVWDTARASGASGIISNYCFCQALFAFHESGMADRLASSEPVSTAALVEGLDEALGTALLKYLHIRGVVEPGEGEYRLTERGRLLSAPEVVALIGFYTEAYAPVLNRFAPLLKREIRYGEDVSRDGWALSKHCEVLARSFATGIIMRALDTVGAKHVVDLGSGNCAFLIDSCKQDPTFHGIGLDNSPEAIAYARKLVDEEGLGDRIEVVLGDAFKPETWPVAIRRADAFLTVGTLHEHFRAGEQAMLDLLNRYAEMMLAGDVKTFLLVEPEIYYTEKDAEFFLMHALTKQGFPRRRELWLEIIAKSRLRCRRLYYIPNIPFSFVYYDLVPTSR